MGWVKKTPLAAFKTISSRGLIIVSLEDGDELRWARVCQENEEIFIATRNGFASRFSSTDLSSTGRKSRGIRSLLLREGDRMIDMDILRPHSNQTLGVEAKNNQEKETPHKEQHVLLITKRGYGKRVPMNEFRTQRRGGKGMTAIRFKTKAKSISEGSDTLACMRVCDPGDEVVISTERGTSMTIM